MRDNVCVFFSPAAMALGGVGFLWRGLVLFGDVDATVLGLVGGAPGGETPRVADSSAAGAGRFFHNSVVLFARDA